MIVVLTVVTTPRPLWVGLRPSKRGSAGQGLPNVYLGTELPRGSATLAAPHFMFPICKEVCLLVQPYPSPNQIRLTSSDVRQVNRATVRDRITERIEPQVKPDSYIRQVRSTPVESRPTGPGLALYVGLIPVLISSPN